SMRRLAVLVVSAVCLSSSLHAQDSKTLREPGPIAKSADRIARELWPTEPRAYTIDDEGRPRFRINKTETTPPTTRRARAFVSTRLKRYRRRRGDGLSTIR